MQRRHTRFSVRLLPSCFIPIGLRRKAKIDVDLLIHDAFLNFKKQAINIVFALDALRTGASDHMQGARIQIPLRELKPALKWG
jgi:hypothetical protein